MRSIFRFLVVTAILSGCALPGAADRPISGGCALSRSDDYLEDTAEDRSVRTELALTMQSCDAGKIALELTVRYEVVQALEHPIGIVYELRTFGGTTLETGTLYEGAPLPQEPNAFTVPFRLREDGGYVVEVRTTEQSEGTPRFGSIRMLAFEKKGHEIKELYNVFEKEQ